MQDKEYIGRSSLLHVLVVVGQIGKYLSTSLLVFFILSVSFLATYVSLYFVAANKAYFLLTLNTLLFDHVVLKMAMTVSKERDNGIRSHGPLSLNLLDLFECKLFEQYFHRAHNVETQWEGLKRSPSIYGDKDFIEGSL